jgi:3D (Asp-Asp-Asp) domain-containing protein
MRMILACLAAWSLTAPATTSQAQTQIADPIGDLIAQADAPASETGAGWGLKATLYHGGRAGGLRDSLGCKTSPMRTVAVDPTLIAPRSIVYIKQTAGLSLGDGSVHDGYWYASDSGGAIRGRRIDLYTGAGGASMRPLMALNLRVLTVARVGAFSGCPPVDGGAGRREASAAP